MNKIITVAESVLKYNKSIADTAFHFQVSEDTVIRYMDKYQNGFRPKHDHDCDRCIFLGRDEDHNADLYFCPADDYKHTTVVYRYSSEGSNYGSGLAFYGINPLATKATNLAIDQGLITREQVAWHSRKMKEELK